MNLYHLSQDEVAGYGTFSGMVVAAADEKSARRVHPPTSFLISWNEEHDCWWHKRRKRLEEYRDISFNTPDEYVEERYRSDYWANHQENIKVVFLGAAHNTVRPGVILASFHAG